MVECPSCHQNGKYINFTLWFCRGWHGLLHRWIPHGKHAYFSSDQSNFQFMALWLPFLSLMLKLLNSDLQQPRRLRQIERQGKVNLCSMVAMLRLLLFARILSLSNYAKIGPVGVNLIQLIKDSLLGVHVVVKTINLEILGCLTTSEIRQVFFKTPNHLHLHHLALGKVPF